MLLLHSCRIVPYQFTRTLPTDERSVNDDKVISRTRGERSLAAPSAPQIRVVVVVVVVVGAQIPRSAQWVHTSVHNYCKTTTQCA
jgi:hypothetical protein